MAGPPVQEESVRTGCGVSDQALVSGLRIAGVETPRRAGPIELHRRVVHGVRPWQELPRLDVAGGAARYRQHEVAIHVVAGGTQAIRRRLQYQVRLAQPPARSEE